MMYVFKIACLTLANCCSIESKLSSPNTVGLGSGGGGVVTAAPVLEEMTNGSTRLFLLDAGAVKRESGSVSALAQGFGPSTSLLVHSKWVFKRK